MYRAHPTHGAGTWPHRTQLKTAARKTTLNTGQCVRQPREGRGRNRQAPPQKKKKGGGKGKRHENSPQPPNHPPTPPQAARPPPQEKKKKKKKGGTPAEAQANHPPKTGNTKPVTADHGEKGQKKKRKKREPPARPERKGMEGQGPQSPEKKKKKKEKKKPKQKKKKKKTPRQPSQDGLGTGETRARHTRPHRAPEPETAGGKRGAHETTHVPKADRNRSPTTNTTNSRH